MYAKEQKDGNYENKRCRISTLVGHHLCTKDSTGRKKVCNRIKNSSVAHPKTISNQQMAKHMRLSARSKLTSLNPKNYG